MQIIGTIKLAPGRVGFFDDLTRIHLTLANNIKPVYAGMNTSNLKRGVKYGSLLLVSGTLDASEAVVEAPKAEPAKRATVAGQEKNATKVVEVKEEIAEEIKEEAVETKEVKEEPKKAAPSKRKKAPAKEEVTEDVEA